MTHGTPLAGPPGRSVFGDVLAELGELDVAQEELRVADEALREYGDQLAALVGRHQEEQRWRERVAALVPVCQLTTDLVGTVRQADAATARLLGVPTGELAGKPLAAFLAADRRAPLRAALSALGTGAPEVRVLLPVRPRGAAALDVDAVGAGEGNLVRWVLLPAVGTASADTGLAAAAAVAALIRLPAETDDPQTLLSRLAVAVRDAIGPAAAVTLTLGSPTDPERVASDSRLAQRLDGLVLRLGEGPSLTAAATGATASSGDLPRDDRWPRLAAAAGPVGLRSVLALPVVLGDRRLGVLTLGAQEPDAFGDRERRLAELVATTVAAVLEQAAQQQSLRALTDHLRHALTARAVIEQAKGVVMAHHGGTADEAFSRLVTLSNARNVKLRDLAASLVEDGAQQGLEDGSLD